MKTTRVFLMIVLWLSGSMLFNTCQYDEFDDQSLFSEGDALGESTLLVYNNQPACINPDDPVYAENTQQETAKWGNPKNPFVKTVDIVYYNTLTQFVLKVKSTQGWADLLIDGESVWGVAPVDENVWGEYSIDLPDQWEAGDAYSFELEVTGFGPPALFDVGYNLVGKCIEPSTSVTFTYNGEEVTYGVVESAGQYWLDRNLGASRVAISSTDADAYGDLFQWGRLDDGHQLRTSATTAILSSSAVPGHGHFITSIAQANWDWLETPNNDLWQGVDGINNPCPPGFRLPTNSELLTEFQSWSKDNAIEAFASPLKLPMAGYRYSVSGVVENEDLFGYYWASTVDDGHSWLLYFANPGAGVASFVRARGGSVRCIKN